MTNPDTEPLIPGETRRTHEVTCCGNSCLHLKVAGFVICALELAIMLIILSFILYHVLDPAFGEVSTFGYVVVFGYCSAFTAAAILVIVAILKEKPNWIIPHVVLQCVGVLLAMIVINMVIIYASSDHVTEPRQVAEIVVLIVGLILLAALGIWFIYIFLRLRIFLQQIVARNEEVTQYVNIALNSNSNSSRKSSTSPRTPKTARPVKPNAAVAKDSIDIRRS